MALIAGSLPPNTCYGTPQQLLDLFGAYLSLPGQNIVLEAKKSTAILTGLSAGTQAIGNVGTDIIIVSGATVGDPVLVGGPVPTNGTIIDAYVSGANTVTIRCTYVKAIPLITGASTYSVKVFKFAGTY